MRPCICFCSGKIRRIECISGYHFSTACSISWSKYGCTGHKQLRAGKAPAEVPVGRIPRISKLMALAIHFDQLIRDGVVANQAEIARQGS